MSIFSRRDFLRSAAQTGLLVSSAPLASAFMRNSLAAGPSSMRCINVINFIRGVEPREPMDLLLPVQKQMDEVLARQLPATWLLQYDALVEGPFVGLLKSRMAANHEVGFWFEMNELLCKAANVDWRGRPGFEWDSHPSVAFTIGYSEEERIKLADAAMAGFHSVWGRYPSSVASWNLDSISMAHLTDKYSVDAFAVCRDQIATDGFTIWGAPIAGYYPSKLNCWSPALSRHNQIHAPVFRMLGQDPVYYYNRQFPLPDGRRIGQPDTMEPVWISGRSPRFIELFLEMISKTACLDFAYAQLGQENNFGWPEMAEAYPKQMTALAQLRDAGAVHVETMGDTGRRFKRAFSSTPVQAQIALQDPFGNTDPAEKSIWYQSRFYRANLHFIGDLPFLRDLTVYSDQLEQPFLTKPTRESDVEQRLPAVLDGYHWSAHPGKLGEPEAGGFFSLGEGRLHATGAPSLVEDGKSLVASFSTSSGTLRVRFDEQEISVSLEANAQSQLRISFEWDASKFAFPEIASQKAAYRRGEFAYDVLVKEGLAKSTATGWSVEQGRRGIRLWLAQTS